MKPVFMSTQVFDYQGKSNIVKEQHLRIVAHQKNGSVIEGIGFGLADKYELVRNGAFDMVYNMEENEFNGTTRLQVKVIDIRKSVSIN
jgi:single-stranded-DNA-specific exonuclease